MSQSTKQFIEEQVERFVKTFPHTESTMVIMAHVVDLSDFLRSSLTAMAERRDEKWRERIDMLANKQIELFKGKLPFVVFEGKATEEEKIAIYRQALKDLLNLNEEEKKYDKRRIKKTDRKCK